MKRTVQIVGELGLAGVVLLGGTASASAHVQKPATGKGTVKTVGSGVDSCVTHCRPPKTPPPGGWPCKADKSCASKHHYKPCPPVKPPTKPPVTPVPKPPQVTPPKPHHVPATPVARSVPNTPQLALTGLPEGTPILAGLGLGGILLGVVPLVLIRQPRKQAKATRDAL